MGRESDLFRFNPFRPISGLRPHRNGKGTISVVTGVVVAHSLDSSISALFNSALSLSAIVVLTRSAFSLMRLF